MVRSYLRYEHDQLFGVISSGTDCPSVLTNGGKLAVSPAMEDVYIWNIKSGSLIKTLKFPRIKGIISKTVPLVTALCLLKGSDTAAVGYSDGSIRLWNVTNESVMTTLRGHKSAITKIAYDRKSELLISGSGDTDVVVWDVVGESGLVKLKGHKDAVTDIVILNKRFFVTSSKDYLVKLWDLDLQSCVQTLVGHRSEVWSLCIMDDLLLTAGGDSEIKMWKINASQDGSIALEEHGSFARSQTKNRVACLRTLGNYLFAQNAGKHIEVFRRRAESEVSKKVQRVKKRLREKNVETDKEIASFAFEFETLESSQRLSKIKGIDIEGDLVLLSQQDNRAVLFTHKEGVLTESVDLNMQGHRNPIRSLAISSDDLLLLTSSIDGCKLWNLHSKKCIRNFECDSVLSCMFLPGNRHFVAGTKTGKIILVSISSGEILQTIDSHSGSVWSLHMHVSNQFFVSAAADKDIKIWTFGSQNGLSIELSRCLSMDDDALVARFSPDGKCLAVSSIDSQVRIFHTDTLNFKLALYGHQLPVLSLDFSSDSNLVVTGSADKSVKVWGMDFGDCHRSFRDHSDSVTQVLFVPDTHIFFSASKDRTIIQYDADKLVRIQTLQGHSAEIWALCVSNSANLLVSTDNARAIRSWEESDTPIFLEDERQQELDQLLDQEAVRDADAMVGDEKGPSALPFSGISETPEAVAHSKSSLESVKGAEKIMAILDIAKGELLKSEEERKSAPHPLFSGKTITNVVVDSLRQIPSADLRVTMIVLPYQHVLLLLKILAELESQRDLEVALRCIFILIETHYLQMIADQDNLELLKKLSSMSKQRMSQERDLFGYNVAAVKVMKNQLTPQNSFESKKLPVKKVKVTV